MSSGWRWTDYQLHGRVEGRRSRGRQRKIWADNVREVLPEKNIDLTRIGEATMEREVWNSLIRASSSALMVERKEKRRRVTQHPFVWFDEEAVNTYRS